ncbi:MAG: hypothetical protein ACRCWM_07540 [Sarcina sp.]
MEKFHAIKGVSKIKIDTVEFRYMNGYKIFKKNKKLYFQFNQEVASDVEDDKIFEIIKLSKYDSIHTILVTDLLICEDGTEKYKEVEYKCVVPDVDLFKVDCCEITNYGMTFEILEIKN